MFELCILSWLHKGPLLPCSGYRSAFSQVWHSQHPPILKKCQGNYIKSNCSEDTGRTFVAQFVSRVFCLFLRLVFKGNWWEVRWYHGLTFLFMKNIMGRHAVYSLTWNEMPALFRWMWIIPIICMASVIHHCYLWLCIDNIPKGDPFK